MSNSKLIIHNSLGRLDMKTTYNLQIGRSTLAAMLLLFFTAAVVGAQVGGGFDLSWSTVDGGGTASTGGTFSLGGTIGQPDAGSSAGGTFGWTGGFWGA